MRPRLLSAPLLAAVILFAATGCGGATPSGKPPTLGALLSSSVKAVTSQPDVKVHYALDAKLDAQPSAEAGAQTKLWLSHPIALHAEGGLSKVAVTAKGNLNLAGKRYDAQLLAGPAETYVNLMGVWYGNRTQGLNTAGDDHSAGSLDPVKLQRALAQVQNHADDALDADVSAGPDIDGATWQAKGTCDAAGIIRLAKANGETVTAEDEAAVPTFCDAAKFTYVVGANDRLPRRLSVDLKLDDQTLHAVSAEDDSGADTAKELDSLDLSATITLTDWGKDVTYRRPTHTRSFDALGSALLGIAFSLAGGQTPGQ